jgi:Uncharacterized protein conserved in bacteria
MNATVATALFWIFAVLLAGALLLPRKFVPFFHTRKTGLVVYGLPLLLVFLSSHFYIIPMTSPQLSSEDRKRIEDYGELLPLSYGFQDFGDYVTYLGAITDNKPSGLGVLTLGSESGDSIQIAGRFDDRQLNGFGLIRYTAERYYIGSIRNNVPDGEGVLFYGEDYEPLFGQFSPAFPEELAEHSEWGMRIDGIPGEYYGDVIDPWIPTGAGVVYLSGIGYVTAIFHDGRMANDTSLGFHRADDETSVVGPIDDPNGYGVYIMSNDAGLSFLFGLMDAEKRKEMIYLSDIVTHVGSPAGGQSVSSSNGSIIAGIMPSSALDGTGTIQGFFEDGEYLGEFAAARPHGLGQVAYQDGSRYTGYFADGAYEGVGRFTTAYGTTYTGEFLNGFYHGKGKEVHADGTMYIGTFQDGELVNGVKVYPNKVTYRIVDGVRKEGSGRLGVWMDMIKMMLVNKYQG